MKISYTPSELRQLEESLEKYLPYRKLGKTSVTPSELLEMEKRLEKRRRFYD